MEKIGEKTIIKLWGGPKLGKPPQPLKNEKKRNKTDLEKKGLEVAQNN